MLLLTVCMTRYYSLKYIFYDISLAKTYVYNFGAVVLEVVTGRSVVNEPVKELGLGVLRKKS